MAANLYGGHLLAEMAIPEEAWTEWIEAQRQRLEGLALDAMVKLGEQELEAGNHEPALSAANRAIAISGLREDAHRLMMRVLAAGGRREEFDRQARIARQKPRQGWSEVAAYHYRRSMDAQMPAR